MCSRSPAPTARTKVAVTSATTRPSRRTAAPWREMPRELSCLRASAGLTFAARRAGRMEETSVVSKGKAQGKRQYPAVEVNISCARQLLRREGQQCAQGRDSEAHSADAAEQRKKQTLKDDRLHHLPARGSERLSYGELPLPSMERTSCR